MAIFSDNNMKLYVVLLLSIIKGFSTSACKFDVKMKQLLVGDGFHRNITYSVTLSSDEDRWTYRDCVVALDQYLPAGVYVNSDELGDLKRTTNLNAIAKTRANIELPTEHSQPSSVYVIGKVTQNHMLLWLPVHARYHQAQAGGGNARNKIKPPKMYMRCPDRRLEACNPETSPTATFQCSAGTREKCIWKEVPYTVTSDQLSWEIPVGNRDHYYIVALGTGGVIAIGSLYLLKSIHEYKTNVKKKA